MRLFVVALIPTPALGKTAPLRRHRGRICVVIHERNICIDLVSDRASPLRKRTAQSMLQRDIAELFMLTVLCSMALKSFVVWPAARAKVAILIMLSVLALVIVAGIASSWMRDTVYRKYRSL